MFNLKQKGKILAIDFGHHFVGLAVSDDARLMAFGRGVIKGYKSLRVLFDKLRDFCLSEKVVLIVMGLPFGSDGVETKKVVRLRSIGKKLEEFLGIPVDFVDESYSSFEAGQRLMEMGVKFHNVKEREDEVAAVLILERYLRK